jgi:hypothetical protein
MQPKREKSNQVGEFECLTAVFRLIAQLDRAATQGRIDVLINSGELCRCIPKGSSSSISCCDAMQAEFKLGDTLLLDRSNGAGMTVRYLLPRAAAVFITGH